jgi:hypothetical protein
MIRGVGEFPIGDKGTLYAVLVLHIPPPLNVCNGSYGSGLSVRFDLVAVALVVERAPDGQLIPNITDRPVERRYVGVGR